MDRILTSKTVLAEALCGNKPEGGSEFGNFRKSPAENFRKFIVIFPEIPNHYSFQVTVQLITLLYLHSKGLVSHFYQDFKSV